MSAVSAEIDGERVRSREELFEELVQYFSKKDYEQELLRARESFFERLGRSHEMSEAHYENVSQSFLEWYLYDFKTQRHGRSPVVTYLSLERGRAADREVLRRSLFHHWTVLEVEEVSRSKLKLKDLLFGKTRILKRIPDSPVFRSWSVSTGQVIQTRLYSTAEDPQEYEMSHLWIHPHSEVKIVKEVCERLQPKWSLHRGFLRRLQEAVIRSFQLVDQMKAARSQNFLYEKIRKRYVET